MMPPSPSRAEWDEQRENLREHYFSPDHKNLKVLSQLMLTKYGFRASPTQYQNKFDEWGFRKNLRKDECKIIIAKTKKRKRELGKDSTVELFGNEMPEKRLKKIEQGFTLSELSSMQIYEDMPTPPGISVQTPPATAPDFALENIPSAIKRIPIPPNAAPSRWLQTENLHISQLELLFTPNVFKVLFPRSSKTNYHSIGLDASYGEHDNLSKIGVPIIYGIDNDLGWTHSNNTAISPLPRNLISEMEHIDNKVPSHPCRPLVLSRFATGVFERHPGEYQNRLAVLSGPPDSTAYKEFLTIVVCIISNNLINIHDVRAVQILEWVTQQSGMDLHRLFDFDIPTVHASLEFLLKVAISSNGRKITAGKALLAADTKRKLFSGRPLKLLEAAVILEDEGLIQELIGKGVLVDYLSRVNELFIQAIKSGQVELVRFYLQHGASLKIPNLMKIVHLSGSLPILKIILAYGCANMDQDAEHFKIQVTEEDLRSFAGFECFPYWPHTEMLSLLLKTRSGKQVLSSRDFSSKFLNSAAVNGQLDVVQCLVESGADVNLMGGIFNWDKLHNKWDIHKSSMDQITSRPITCLFGAAVAGRTEVVQFLMRNNAEVDYQLPGNHPRTAVEAALINGHHNIVCLLLQAGATYSSLDMRSIDDLAVTEAAKAGNLELVRTLILNGANPSFILEAWEPYKTYDKYSPNTGLTDLFLWGGGKSNAKGPRSEISALQFAIIMRDFKAAKSMIEAGAQLSPPKLNAPSCHQFHSGYVVNSSILLTYSIFQLTVNVLSTIRSKDIEKHLWFLRFLLKIGPTTDLPLIANYSGPEILQRAIWVGGDIDIVRFLVEEAGADVNYASFKDRILSPLETAVQFSNLEIVKYLLSVGADVNGRYGVGIDDGKQQHRSNRHTALQLATHSEGVDMELIQTLLEYGAEVNAPAASEEWDEGGGWTALQGAAMYGHINLVHFLIQRGADVNAEGCGSADGITALGYAAVNGHLDTVQLLLDAGATKLDVPAKLAERRQFFVIADLLKAEMKKRAENVKRNAEDPEDLYKEG